MKRIAAVVLLCLSGAVAAQASPPTIDQLETQESLHEVLDLLATLETSFGTLDRARLSERQRAFGHEQFCGCLSDKLPVAWTFAQYVAITTRSQEENGYATLEGDVKSVYDMVAPVREECVVEMRQ